MSEEIKPLTLLQRIREAIKLMEVGKNGFNAFQNYKYRSDEDIKEACKKACSELGIVIIPNCTSIVDCASGVRVMVEYSVYNADDKNDCLPPFSIPGDGQDKGDKGVYKALTGSWKYAMSELFVIATGDDAEKDADKAPGKPVEPRKQAPGPQWQKYEKREWLPPNAYHDNADIGSDYLVMAKPTDSLKVEVVGNPWMYVFESKTTVKGYSPRGKTLYQIQHEQPGLLTWFYKNPVSKSGNELVSPSDYAYISAAIKHGSGEDWYAEAQEAVEEKLASPSTGLPYADDEIPF